MLLEALRMRWTRRRLPTLRQTTPQSPTLRSLRDPQSIMAISSHSHLPSILHMSPSHPKLETCRTTNQRLSSSRMLMSISWLRTSKTKAWRNCHSLAISATRSSSSVAQRLDMREAFTLLVAVPHSAALSAQGNSLETIPYWVMPERRTMLSFPMSRNHVARTLRSRPLLHLSTKTIIEASELHPKSLSMGLKTTRPSEHRCCENTSTLCA